jgi:chromosome segregation ATPase
LEVSNIDGDETVMSLASDIWDNIMSLSRKNSKRKHVETPSTSKGTAQWKDRTKHIALTRLLDGAVSHPDIGLRKTYIGRIMNLPPETQRSLMAMIERQKKHTDDSCRPDDSSIRKKKVKTAHTPDDENTRTPAKQRSIPRTETSRKSIVRSPFTPKTTHAKLNMTPGTRGRSLFSTPRRHPQTPQIRNSEGLGFLSPGLGDTAEYEREVQELREQNDQLRSNLEKSRRKEEDMNQKLEDMETSFRNEMMKIEAASHRREAESNDIYKDKIETLEASLRDLSEQSETTERVKAELAGVKDEMELMIHTKSMLDDTTERLNNYKEKIQQLTDVKDALQREEEAHGRSVEENIRLQNELCFLQPLKRQLEEYKSRAVDAEVKFTETQDELMKLRQQRQNSSDTHENFKMTVQSQQEEIEALRTRVRQEESSKEEAAGLGEGISELNPELKEELLRLRNDNKQLKAFAEKRQDDSVSKLEQKAEDSTRLCERYKSQFLSTKGTLETTQLDLKDSMEREQNIQASLADTMGELQEIKNQIDNTTQELTRCNTILDASRNRESNLEEELSSWVDQTKNLQERADDVTRRLQKCSQDLADSLARESDLKESVTDWSGKYEQCTERANDLSQQLQDRSKELQESQTREEELQQDIIEWMEKAKSASELADDISDQLKACSEELGESRKNEAVLKHDLGETFENLRMTENQVMDFQQKISLIETELNEEREIVLHAEERESILQNELVGMRSRAEDAETVLAQKVEFIETITEQLTESEARVGHLTEREDALTNNVNTWIEKAAIAEGVIEKQQIELHNAREMISNIKSEMMESQDNVDNLKTTLEALKNELAESKDLSTSVHHQAEQLLVDLTETRLVLDQHQESLAQSQSSEAELNEQLAKAYELTSGLEEEIQEERTTREKIEEDLQSAFAEKHKMEQELKTHMEKSNKQIEAEVKALILCKDNLGRAQEALNETESSLGAAQHREKMLQHKVTILEDRESELHAAIEAERMKASSEIQESTKSFEVTCEFLSAKARRDMDELQSNMNQLLENERKSKRSTEEACQEKIKKMREEMSNEFNQLKAEAFKSMESAQHYKAELTEKLRKEYEEKLVKVKQEADDESTKLVRKGKCMLKELKAKQKESSDKLHQDISSLEEKFDVVKKQKESISAQFKTKASEYKKKLHFASGRINRLTAESDDFEERIKNLEREKYKLREENDRYRRQLGGRFGSDSNGQNQLEVLQKELKSACDEIRELKRQQRNGGRNALASINEGSEGIEHSYSRDVANHSTISQLRSEYEETIEVLNDEKRELVMRNSAAITDVQKAEKRAWESEQENATLKQQLTSMTLQVERFGHIQPSDDSNKQRVELSSSNVSSVSMGIDRSHSSEATEVESTISSSLLSNSMMSLSQPSEKPGESSSPVPFVLGQSSGDDRPPECQQS